MFTKTLAHFYSKMGSMTSQNPYGNYSSGSGNQPASQNPPTYGTNYGVSSADYNNSGYLNPAYGSNTGGYHGNGYPVARPRPHVGFGEALKKWKDNMFHFSGRASRSEYWWIQLFWFLIMLTVMVIIFIIFFFLGITGAQSPSDEYTTSDNALIGLIFALYGLFILLGLAQLITTFALGWRRLQDAGFPGALYLLNLVGLGIVPFVMSVLPSSPSGVQYDKPVDRNRP